MGIHKLWEFIQYSYASQTKISATKLIRVTKTTHTYTIFVGESSGSSLCLLDGEFDSKFSDKFGSKFCCDSIYTNLLNQRNIFESDECPSWLVLPTSTLVECQLVLE